MNKTTELLNIEYPIISAAMNWVTSAEFVAAVCNAGGMGVLGPNAGQKLHPTNLKEYADNLRNEIRKVKQLTNKNFAVNYIFPLDDSGTLPFGSLLFDIIVEEEVKYVVAIGNQMVASEMIKLKEQGITVIYRPLNPTVHNILEAEKHGADAVIVTGSEAGGIIDGRGAKAAFAMGAQGVYMGTRFIATVENPASPAAKQAIIDVKSEEILELDGVYERTIPTPGGKKAYQLINEGKSLDAVPYHKNGYKETLLLGNLDQGTISVSPSAGGIQEILTCQEVIDEIINYISY